MTSSRWPTAPDALTTAMTPRQASFSLSFHSSALARLHVCSCAGHTDTHRHTHTHMGACDAARLGRAPVAWFSEAALTGLFVSAVELKIKPGKEFG